ncbi:ROK family protein [Pedobacter sp. UBA4863]|uniref:ROK family protein n=1 Tax=Pedobacter sp. UBA4863 TaxID=1947060 RepID=UPI0025DEFAF1|nr:ROK family protein [Pedobacter sp. UBA4863]
MINEGLIAKKGSGQSIGGRKPDLYTSTPGNFFVLGIEMDRYQTKMAILDNTFNYAVPTKTLSLDIEKEARPIELLHSLATELIENSKIDKNKLIGIGVSMPGLVDAKQGHNHTFIVATEQLKTLKEELENTFNRPVYIQNDVKCLTSAEKHFGLAKDKNDALLLFLDWGIGLGIIMDGEIRGGRLGFSGEIGHMPFKDEGILCYCGKRGCLETVASGMALAKIVKEGIQSGQHSLLNNLPDSEIDKIEPQVIINAAKRGDQYAIKILGDIGYNVGRAVASTIQLFNPELIILAGRIAQAQEYITIPMQQAINTYCMAQIREDVVIKVSELTNNPILLGLTSNVLNQHLETTN